MNNCVSSHLLIRIYYPNNYLVVSKSIQPFFSSCSSSSLSIMLMCQFKVPLKISIFHTKQWKTVEYKLIISNISHLKMAVPVEANCKRMYVYIILAHKLKLRGTTPWCLYHAQAWRYQKLFIFFTFGTLLSHILSHCSLNNGSIQCSRYDFHKHALYL